MNQFEIAFAAEPSIGVLDLATMALSWHNQVPDDDAIFRHLDQALASGGFDWYFHDQIMLIPDPIASPHQHWQNVVTLGKQTIACSGSTIACFHYETIAHTNFASSLTIPEFQHLEAEFALA